MEPRLVWVILPVTLAIALIVLTPVTRLRELVDEQANRQCPLDRVHSAPSAMACPLKALFAAIFFGNGTRRPDLQMSPFARG